MVPGPAEASEWKAETAEHERGSPTAAAPVGDNMHSHIMAFLHMLFSFYHIVFILSSGGEAGIEYWGGDGEGLSVD
jgi:hypothetical protein